MIQSKEPKTQKYILFSIMHVISCEIIQYNNFEASQI